MTLDNEGHLYLTGDGVVVFDSAGRQIDRIRVPDEQWTANVSFGGNDRRMLFITASTGLYGVRMRVTGANAAKRTREERRWEGDYRGAGPLARRLRLL